MKKYLVDRIKSTFFRWLCSYLIILFVPVLLGGIIFAYSLHNIQQETDTAQNQMLEQMRQHFDNQITLMYNTCYTIINTRDVKNALMTEERDGYSVDQLLSIREVQRQLQTETTINEAILAMYIYFPGTDFVLGYNLLSPLDDTAHYAVDRYGCSVQRFRELACQSDFYGNLYVMEDRLFYSYSNQLGTGKILGGAMVLIELDENVIAPGLQIANATTYLLSEDRQCYGTQKEKRMSSEMIQCVLEEKTEEKIKLEQEYILALHAEHVPWYYISVMSSHLYQQKVERMTWIILGYFFVCLVGGGVIVFWLTRRNYLPVKELLQLVIRPNRSSGDEFVQIRESYQSMRSAYLEGKVRENEAKRKEMNRHRLDFFTGKTEIVPHAEIGEWEGKVAKNVWWMIGVEIVAEDSGQVETGLRLSENIDEAYFVLHNVFQEMFESNYHVCAAVGDSMLFALVSSSEMREMGWIEEDIPRRLREVALYLKNNYWLRCFMYMSDRHTNMEQVQDAYQEIQSEVEYRNRQQSTISDFLSIRDVPEGLERMEYYAKCRKIYQQLLDQEPEKALKGFSELFAELQQERADEGKEEGETTRIERLVDQAKHYIEAHYRESSLTAGKVSDELSVNQSYLSREFKRINGVGILEYISQLRLEYAKKLLAEGATVREAALQIGYFDTQPLVRIFRQMEGITPSEYRQSQQKNKLETEKK